MYSNLDKDEKGRQQYPPLTSNSIVGLVDRGYYCVDIPGNYTQSRTDVGDRACSDENKDTACALKWSLRIKYCRESHLQKLIILAISLGW